MLNLRAIDNHLPDLFLFSPQIFLRLVIAFIGYVVAQISLH
ncbi:hypothetical protein [Chroococcidiopsis sp. CCALA 051]